jgi:hypothetical protein
MRRFSAFCLVIILSFFFQLFAAEVGISKAKAVAKNVYYERAKLINNALLAELDFSSEHVFSHEGQKLYYVFNLENNNGFVIISADDIVYPVLGYSFTGSLDPFNLPPNARFWLSRYEEQLTEAKESGMKAGKMVRGAWEKYSNENVLKGTTNIKQVVPLVSSTWSQGNFYNDSCPADPNGSGGHAIVGCVAVAMGQVMRFHESPQQGTGSHSYYHSDYGTLSANFGATTYNWSNMPDDLNSPNADLAQMLYHCGVATEMNYGPYASGTISANARNAFLSYFGYSPTTQLDYKQGYTDEKWNAMLRSELDASWPMYYAGTDLQNMSAHAFVCDGYQGTDHFHFNWGWGGWADGYFYTTDLNPGSSNFNGNQHVIRIRPDGVYDFCWGLTFLDSTSGTFDDGSGGHFYNNNSFCRWVIQPPGAVSITLNFTKFNTEHSADKVNIFDGDNMGSPLLGSFSGNNLPSGVTSSSGKILITFTTDANVGDEGWEASYTSLTTGIDNADQEKKLTVYPNPGNDFFEIEFINEATGDLEVEVTDVTGRMLRTYKDVKDNSIFNKTLDLGEIPSGVYFLSLKMQNIHLTRYIIIE